MSTCHKQERCIGTFFAPDTLEGQEPQFKYPPNGPGSSLAVRKSGRNYFLAQKRTQQRLSLVLKCLRVYTSVEGGARQISRAFLCQEQTLPLFRLLNHGGIFFFLFLSFLSSNGRGHAVRAEDICDPFCSRDLYRPIHPPRTLFGFPFLFSSCVPAYGTQRICVSFPLYPSRVLFPKRPSMSETHILTICHIWF